MAGKAKPKELAEGESETVEEVPGVDPDTGETVSYTVDGLMKSHNLTKSKAERLYDDIAVAAGAHGRGEYGDFRPGVTVEGADKARREAVDEVLASLKEKSV